MQETRFKIVVADGCASLYDLDGCRIDHFFSEGIYVYRVGYLSSREFIHRNWFRQITPLTLIDLIKNRNKNTIHRTIMASKTIFGELSKDPPGNGWFTVVVDADTSMIALYDPNHRLIDRMHGRVDSLNSKRCMVMSLIDRNRSRYEDYLGPESNYIYYTIY